MRAWRRGVAAAVFVLATAAWGRAQEVGYPETFALAEDREKALDELIAGTDAYFYYHALHYQNTGQYDKVRDILGQWARKRGERPQWREIHFRQVLIDYDRDPKGAGQELIRRLGLGFGHARDIDRKRGNLPTRLDGNSIATETLLKRALGYDNHLGWFEDSGLELLRGQDLHPDELRSLLRRLQIPDWPDLAQLVARDLGHPHNGGFGYLPIHGKMTKAQLDELARLRADVVNDNDYINTYLVRLQPDDDTDWRHDPAVRKAYLERLWSFVQKLPPAQNSLKAAVLYHRLVHDRAEGVYDKDRFLAYLKLPRSVNYINRQWLQRGRNRLEQANLRADYRQFIHLPPIVDDEPLVRDCLQHFFLQEKQWKPYAVWINPEYAEDLFAETMLVNGVGDAQEWTALLSPGQNQALRDRVDLAFAPQNQERFGTREKVTLDLYVKNVEDLIVQIYEINTAGYYRETGSEIPLNINLEGLVPNREETKSYDDAPIRRVRRTFAFPQIDKRGVYAIEFIGNGLRSRALIRKGSLSVVERVGAAGQVFTVLDEAKKIVENATILVGDHEYEADDKGRIRVPFSTHPGRTSMIVRDGDFAVLENFLHLGEEYRLDVGFYVARESLRPRSQAKLVIRPRLSVNHAAAAIELLEEPVLTVTAIDGEGVPTTQQVRDLKFEDGKETVHEFRVPDRLRTIHVSLAGKVKALTTGKKVDLAASHGFDVNGIDNSDKVEDFHFSREGGHYVLRLLGKTGEPRVGRQVNIAVKHRDFNQTLYNAALQTDAAGRIELGPLPAIDHITVSSPSGVQRTFRPGLDEARLRSAVHAKAGLPVLIPYMGAQTQPTRETTALLELRGDAYVADRFEAIAIQEGYVVLRGLAPGDYTLVLKEYGDSIEIRVAQGDAVQGVVVGETRMLEVIDPAPLTVAEAAVDAKGVRAVVKGGGKEARVHVVACRFDAPWDLFGRLGIGLLAEPLSVRTGPSLSQYEAERAISDELRYILERKHADKYPGLMLARPGLLLNPWALRETDMSHATGAKGVGFAGGAKGRQRRNGRGGAHVKEWHSDGGSFTANLDFLPENAAVFLNLVPDAQGVVTVPAKDLGPHTMVHILAVEGDGAVYRRLSRPPEKLSALDLRLARGLDPQKHFTEQKLVSVARGKQPFVVEDITTSKVEVYDTLPKVFSLYRTLSEDATLDTFAFLTRWSSLSDAEKRDHYSRHACHELHFFLYQKDRPFFDKVVKPYLANKKDKTFLDDWLLGRDLSAYVHPWAFARLNMAERVLLGRAIADQRDTVARHLREREELLPRDVERFNRLFAAAVRGSSLAADGDRFAAPKEPARPIFTNGAAVDIAEADGVGSDAFGFAADEVAAEAPATESAAAPSAPPMPGPGLQMKARRSKEGQLAGAKKAEGKRLDERGYAKDKADAMPLEELEEMDGAYELETVTEMRHEEAAKRKEVRAFFRKLEKTKEWVENNYYHLPIEQQIADLVPINAFWADYAAHKDGPFLSVHLAECGGSFAEMILALAAMDLPFTAEPADVKLDGKRMTIIPAVDAVVFHKEIRPAQPAEEKTPVLVSQNFFRADDRYRHENGEQFDKYVSDEFLVHVVYGCQVVLTNPTGGRQKLEALLQIPRGALPVRNGFETRGVSVELGAYSTRRIEYFFYFPLPGAFPQYPVHVSRNEDLVAFAPPVTLKVVEEPTTVDKTSWAWISQHAPLDELVAYLNQNNVERLDLVKLAWRMNDRASYDALIPLLRQRHAYDNTLWSYGLYYRDLETAREYMRHRDDFLRQCGPYLVTQLVTIDPVERRTYQHMEYAPYVNARAHRFGPTWKILNPAFHAQYHRLMEILCHKGDLDDTDRMAVTYYLLLQDRVTEGLTWLDAVRPEKLATRLQYDYFRVCAALRRGKVAEARKTAEVYKTYDVPRWRNHFAAALAQIDEIEGAATAVVDEEDRDQRQAALAATAPSLEMKVEAGKIALTVHNLEEVALRFYLMDVELLFSQNPFDQDESGRFAYIRPNGTKTVTVKPGQTEIDLPLPEAYHGANVLIEATGGGLKRTQAYYAGDLAVRLVETYGQVRVTHAKTGKPLAAVYVKVYARSGRGVTFYKDGYTDLRGRFDYASLSTAADIDNVERFAVLVLSDEHGAAIREADPPKQ